MTGLYAKYLSEKVTAVSVLATVGTETLFFYLLSEIKTLTVHMHVKNRGRDSEPTRFVFILSYFFQNFFMVSLKIPTDEVKPLIEEIEFLSRRYYKTRRLEKGIWQY